MRLFVMSLVIAGGLLAMPGCGGGDSGPAKPATNVPPPAAPPKTDAPGGAGGAGTGAVAPPPPPPPG